MKLLVVAVCLVLALAAEAFEPMPYDYHEEIGIPLAARIKAAEEAMDFDGSRIAGGTQPGLGAHPHMGGLVITLTTGGQSVCGSSLISNTRCLTAAHCWRHRNTQARQFVVVLGSVALFSGGTRITTTNVQMHGSYNQNNLQNDIAIIVISSVGFNNNIRAIGLASGTNAFAGSWAMAAGFGRTGDNVGIGQNQRLAQVPLQVITNAVCAQTFGGSIIASTLCCAAPGGRSTCPGDSGGPLNIGNTLIGVTSFGHELGCTRGFPVGFARVTSFNAWIRARM